MRLKSVKRAVNNLELKGFFLFTFLSVYSFLSSAADICFSQSQKGGSCGLK